MTEHKMSEESIREIRDLCQANGFDSKETETIIALVEYAVQPIMARYAKETQRAMKALADDDPDWKRLALIAEGNVILGQADAIATLIVGRSFSSKNLSA